MAVRVLIVDDEAVRVPRITAYARALVPGREVVVTHEVLLPHDLTPYELVFLDHDLGGVDVYDEMKRLPPDAFVGKHVIVHSMNPVGAVNIMRAVTGAASVRRVPLSSMPTP